MRAFLTIQAVTCDDDRWEWLPGNIKESPQLNCGHVIELNFGHFVTYFCKCSEVLPMRQWFFNVDSKRKIDGWYRVSLADWLTWMTWLAWPLRNRLIWIQFHDPCCWQMWTFLFEHEHAAKFSSIGILYWDLHNKVAYLLFGVPL